MKKMFNNISTYDMVKSFLKRNSCQFIEEFERDVEGIEWNISDKEIIPKLYTEGIISERGLKSIEDLTIGDKLCFVYCKPLTSKILHLKYNKEK